MEISKYELRIETEEKNYSEVSNILGVQPKNYKYGWSYTIILEEEKQYYNIIEKFLDILDGKYEKLFNLKIERKFITIWLIYGYHNQCNMEFSPETMERLGKNGITLCISCFEAGE